MSKSLTNLVNLDQKRAQNNVLLKSVVEDLDIFLKTFLDGKNISFSYDLTNSGKFAAKAFKGNEWANLSGTH